MPTFSPVCDTEILLLIDNPRAFVTKCLSRILIRMDGTVTAVFVECADGTTLYVGINCLVSTARPTQVGQHRSTEIEHQTFNRICLVGNVRTGMVVGA